MNHICLELATMKESRMLNASNILLLPTVAAQQFINPIASILQSNV